MKKTMILLIPLLLAGTVALATDQDGDGVADESDNCPLVANPDQNDSNFDNIGQACQGDWDGDGVPDQTDNCWDLANPDQADRDGDEVGDSCDIDRDGDGYTNTFEETLTRTSPDDWDSDDDNVSDYYDCDKLNSKDGLPSDCNSIQIVSGPGSAPTPAESDPFGDDDGDGVLNGEDNCPTAFNPGQQDRDGDGKGDQCDNESETVIEVKFAKGGGGFDGAGCSFVGATPANGAMNLFLMLGLPGLAVWLLRRRG